MDHVAFLFPGGACEKLDVDPYCRCEFRQCFVVLRGEDLRWRHQARLCGVVEGDEHAQQRHECLSAPHVALQQAVHLPAGGHVGAYLFDHPFLGACQLERQLL